MNPVRVLHVSAEATPLIKTGGLADVAAALPGAQRTLGADARLLIPGFTAVIEALKARQLIEPEVIEVGPAFGAARVSILRARLPGSDLPLLVLDAPWYFSRPGNPYVDENGHAWPDSPLRFGLFSWIAAQIAGGQLIPQWQPDVLHCHDWHCALAPVYLARQPACQVRRVFTIHNLAYQGLFALDAAEELMLPNRFLTQEKLEFHGNLSFIKGGIVEADRVTTVSPTYAREILQPGFGEGLDGLLRSRGEVVSGILNGIDDQLWNPATDPELAANYDRTSIAQKQVNRTRLRRELDLNEPGNGLLVGIVSRLSEQKGLDKVLKAAPAMLEQGIQLIVLGSGDAWLERGFIELAGQYPKQVSVSLKFDESLAHRIFGAADAILVPSRYEPCGLTQLYGLRYGALPIVSPVGGLVDTVVDEQSDQVKPPANGFVIGRHETLEGAVLRCQRVFDDRTRWTQLMMNAMAQDNSWRAPAQQYLTLYVD